MGLFFNPRKNKQKWASVVMANTRKDIEVDEKVLDAATKLYIQQHARILYESLQLVLTSKNASTRKSRYKLAEQHLGSLCTVRKFATKEQKKLIDKAYADFEIVKDRYKHPNKALNTEKISASKQKRQDFWDTYAAFEMMEIFSGDDD